MVSKVKTGYISEHMNEATAQQVLEEFYQTYRMRSYGMLELVAFAWEQGYAAKEMPIAPSELDVLADRRDKN